MTFSMNDSMSRDALVSDPAVPVDKTRQAQREFILFCFYVFGVVMSFPSRLMFFHDVCTLKWFPQKRRCWGLTISRCFVVHTMYVLES